jgi:hypothetical protein
VGSFQNLRQ